uniref:Uncharacterized protein n=1 Tax=Panagrolaimus superbus TaxID=310955 RepID=A0A914Y2M6_9BILA
MFEVDTVKKIVEILSRSGKLRCFGLHGLTDIFDVSMFARFFKINANVDVRLEYKKKLSADYKEKLHEIFQELVENPPKMIPYIRFPGYDKVKHAGYEKLYQRQ